MRKTVIFLENNNKTLFFRCQMGKSLCEHNEDSQCVENFSWILEPAAYKNNPLRFKPCERHIYRIVFNGHSALNVPVTVQNGHKSYDYQELCQVSV